VYGIIEYFQFFGVGVIVMAIFMTTMMGGAFALIRDREQGIIEGYLVTPVKRSSIILGIIGSGTVRAFSAGFAGSGLRTSTGGSTTGDPSDPSWFVVPNGSVVSFSHSFDLPDASATRVHSR
jgi:ABC-type multidrug transport system permease subunit